MSAPNIKQVAAAALASIERVLVQWLPDGRRNGKEWVALNPTRSDAKLGSFTINLSSGRWADFASDDKGGDLVSLIAYLEGRKQSEAARRLAEFLGLAIQKTDAPQRPVGDPKTPPNTITPAQSNKPAWRALLPVPDGAPPPYATHPKHGKPSMRWPYRAADGGLLCWVLRFEPKDEGERKQFMPLTYCEDETGKRAWRWQGLPDPRPLYNMDKLTANTSTPVIVCEGEKAADAAALLFPDAVCTTMLNGAQSPHKTDWSPLADRTVWLWPDHDEAGRECMVKVATLAKEAGAASVEMFNLDAFACDPCGDAEYPEFGIKRPLPEKWDAADALAAGWSAGHVGRLMQSPDFLQPPPVDTSAQVASAPGNTATDDAGGEQLPHFHCNDQGIWYFGKNEHGNNMPPVWVCSSLSITARTRDVKNGNWGLVIEFCDLDGTPHVLIMPMELLSGDGNEYRRLLLSMGLQIAASGKARNLLTQYIQTAQVEPRARCVDRTGWHGNVFVMADRTIGEDDERILFQSASATPSTLRKKGTLATWQENVAALCVGNSRLVFAVSSAFAAPLLHITGMESGGVHLRGDSSTGKTTALRVAASVLGGPEYMKNWRGTDNGQEATAQQHSDMLLVLDELSQVDPKAAGEVAYMLANGGGKARANRTGGLRDPATWRILFLSSGEAGLAEHMAEAKKKPKAGQEIRLLDIPADAGAGYGMFENLHSYANGAKFSKALTEAACKYYGTAAQPYIEKLVGHSDKIAAWVKKSQSEFTHEQVDAAAGGQVHRAALRFALIGVAGELATKFAITGWQPGEAMQAAAACYKGWLAHRGGAGNLEELNMLAQVRRFFEAHGEARFTDWQRSPSDSDGHNARTIQRAGYRKHITETETTTDGRGDDQKIAVIHTEYYVFPETFKSEVCAGFDYRAVCKLLVKHECLMTEGKGYTRKERLPGGEGESRCFRITHKLFEGGSDE